jgi:hypothetical protein
MTKDSEKIEETKRLMGALVRMKPKPHEEMKVGKKASKSQRSGKTSWVRSNQTKKKVSPKKTP